MFNCAAGWEEHCKQISLACLADIFRALHLIVFIFLGSKITVDGDCSPEIIRRLLLRRKAMTNLDGILKNRDFTLPTKVHLVKAMVFLVVMYRCGSRTIRKAEHQRTDAFKLWC